MSNKKTVWFNMALGISIFDIDIYIYIYMYNCRQYCFGLLGLISAVLMSGMEVKLIKPPQMSHVCGTSICIYIYIRRLELGQKHLFATPSFMLLTKQSSGNFEKKW